jgi:hypothetical protein
MSDDERASTPPGGVPAAHVSDRVRSVAARLRAAAQDLSAEIMIDIPGRLGDHEGLLIALANELEQLVK